MQREENWLLGGVYLEQISKERPITLSLEFGSQFPPERVKCVGFRTCRIEGIFCKITLSSIECELRRILGNFCRFAEKRKWVG